MGALTSTAGKQPVAPTPPENRKKQAEAEAEARQRARAPLRILQAQPWTEQSLQQLEARERGAPPRQIIRTNWEPSRTVEPWNRWGNNHLAPVDEITLGELPVQPQWWQQIEANNRRWQEWHRREQQAEARMLATPKDHWVIENDTLSGVFDGHAVNMTKKDAQDFWEKINKMSIAQKRDYWASQPTWMRRATLVMLFGREPMAHEVAEPFFLAPHMHSREERSPVVLYGYNCSQRADRSTICRPLK